MIPNLLAYATNPDLSGGLASWMDPLNKIRNISAEVVVGLSSLGVILAAAFLIFAFYTGSRLGKVVGGVVAAIVAVILTVNSGDVINMFTGAPPA